MCYPREGPGPTMAKETVLFQPRVTEQQQFSNRNGTLKASGRKAKADGIWNLRLYVAGQSPKSVVAFTNLKRICEEHLAGRYRIEVVDLMKSPQLARGDQIIAIPTLVRKLPEPLKRIIGDLSD